MFSFFKSKEKEIEEYLKQEVPIRIEESYKSSLLKYIDKNIFNIGLLTEDNLEKINHQIKEIELRAEDEELSSEIASVKTIYEEVIRQRESLKNKIETNVINKDNVRYSFIKNLIQRIEIEVNKLNLVLKDISSMLIRINESLDKIFLEKDRYIAESEFNQIDRDYLDEVTSQIKNELSKISDDLHAKVNSYQKTYGSDDPVIDPTPKKPFDEILAVTVFKLLMKVSNHCDHDSEVKYLQNLTVSDRYRMLQGRFNSLIMESANQDIYSILKDIRDCSDVVKKEVIFHVVSIIICDGRIEKQESTMLRDISNYLKIPKGTLEEVIKKASNNQR